MKPDEYGKHVRKVHLDLHLPESLDGMFSRFDVEKYIDTLVKAYVNSITFFALCHYGNCYFDTKVGHKHSQLQADYLGELTREAKKRDMAVLAYFSVACNHRSAMDNPQWQTVDHEGKKVVFGGGYLQWVCLNSPYRDWLFSLVREVATKYPVDGLWFDGIYAPPQGCYCQFCREQFLANFGKDMPINPSLGTLESKQIHEFELITMARFRNDLIHAIKKINPELLVSWNHAGDVRVCFPDDNNADIMFNETHTPENFFPSFQGRWFYQFARPYEGCTSRFHYGGWSDFTYKHINKLRIEAATAMAHGGIVDIGDQGMPDGTLDPIAYSIIGKVYSEVKNIEEFCIDTHSVPNIAVLHSYHSLNLSLWLFEQQQLSHFPSDLLPSVFGASRMLTEEHRHFDIISEHRLNCLADYTALIVPDQIYLSDDEIFSIRKYVEMGGALIASYRFAMFDENGKPRKNHPLGDICGVQFKKFSDFSADYITGYDMELGLEGAPILVRCAKETEQGDEPLIPSMECEVVDADVHAWISHPVFERKPTRFFSHNQAPPGPQTRFPAATYRRVGKGTVVYFPVPIFKHYYLDSYYPLRHLFQRLLDLAAPKQAIFVDAPLQVEVTLRKRDNILFVHLVNYANSRFSVKCSPVPVEDIIPVRGVKVRVYGEARSVKLLPEQVELPFKQSGNYVEFTVPELQVHAIVALR